MGEKSCVGNDAPNPATTGQVTAQPPGHLTGAQRKPASEQCPRGRRKEVSLAPSCLFLWIKMCLGTFGFR